MYHLWDMLKPGEPGGGAGGIWELSVSSFHCCELKTIKLFLSIYDLNPASHCQEHVQEETSASTETAPAPAWVSMSLIKREDQKLESQQQLPLRWHL